MKDCLRLSVRPLLHRGRDRFFGFLAFAAVLARIFSRESVEVVANGNADVYQVSRGHKLRTLTGRVGFHGVAPHPCRGCASAVLSGGGFGRE